MEYLIPPWTKQLEAIEKAKDDPLGFGLFFEPRCGKTGTTINILRHKMLQNKRYFKTLIFCPPLVIPVWPKEFEKHSKIPSKEITLLQGPGKKRLELFNKFSESSHHIYVTNYETLLMPDLFKAFSDWHPDAVVCDESHDLKNPSAKRSKLMDRLTNPKVGSRPIVYLLSGTPVLNSPMDLYMQFLIMDGGDTFGKNFFVFRARYFFDKNAGMPAQRYFPDWRIRPGALEDMNERIFRRSKHVTRAQCMELPEEEYILVKCEMRGEQKRHYEEMKKDFVAYAEDRACMANIAIVKALRLMQITSGYMPLMQTAEEDAPPIKIYEDTDKDEKLEALLKELTPSGKFIIWSVWKQSYARIRDICKKLGLKYVEVHGEISLKEQAKAVKAFQEDPDIQVFSGNPRCAGIGIDLVCAPYMAFYSRNFSLKDYLQGLARNKASHQKKKMLLYDLVCEDTIDELAVKRLANKEEMGEKLLKDLVRELKTLG